MKNTYLVITVLAIATLLFLPLAASADEVWNFWGTQVPFQNASTSSPAAEISGPYPTSVTNARWFYRKVDSIRQYRCRRGPDGERPGLLIR